MEMDSGPAVAMTTNWRFMPLLSIKQHCYCIFYVKLYAEAQHLNI